MKSSENSAADELLDPVHVLLYRLTEQNTEIAKTVNFTATELNSSGIGADHHHIY